MKIDYDGRTWQFSLEDMTVPECMAVEKYVGKGLGEWANQMTAGSVKSIIALWWVLRSQAGETPGAVDDPGAGFKPIRLLAAFHAADVEPEPDPTPAPTSPGRAATATTPASADPAQSPPG